MLLGGKCSLSKEQIKDRKHRGAQYLEFHTDYIDFKDMSYSNLVEIKKYLDNEGLVSYCVHSPMKNSGKPLLLSEPNKKFALENRYLIEKTIEYADILCEYKNPIIVIHPSYELSINEKYDLSKVDLYNQRFLEEIAYIDSYVKSNAPNVRIGVENTCPVTLDKKTKDLVVHAGFVYPDYATQVKELNLSNTGVVLDTCHALANVRLHNLINRNINPITIIDYLEKSKDNLELIHLNNLSHFGEIELNHSTPFHPNGENYKELELIFEFLIKNKYKNPITLEVLETDYSCGDNYSIIKNTCVELLEIIKSKLK